MAGWIGRAITTALWGVVLVLAAGIGLICYGVFAVVSARRRLLVGP